MLLASEDIKQKQNERTCEGVGIYRYIPRFVSRWGSHDAGRLNSWPTTCRHATFICIPTSASPPCSLPLKGAGEGSDGGEEGVQMSLSSGVCMCECVCVCVCVLSVCIV